MLHPRTYAINQFYHARATCSAAGGLYKPKAKYDDDDEAAADKGVRTDKFKVLGLSLSGTPSSLSWSSD